MAKRAAESAAYAAMVERQTADADAKRAAGGHEDTMQCRCAACVAKFKKLAREYKCPPGCDCDTCSYVRGIDRR